jgi:hypothetical protein
MKRIVVKFSTYIPRRIKDYLLASQFGWRIKRSLLGEYRTQGIDQNDLASRIYILEQLVDGLTVEWMEHIQNCKRSK